MFALTAAAQAGGCTQGPTWPAVLRSLESAEIGAVLVADGQRAAQALRRDPDCVAAARGLKRLRALAAAKEAGNAAFKAGDWRAAHAQYSAALVHNTPGSGNAAFMAQCACNRCAPRHPPCTRKAGPAPQRRARPRQHHVHRRGAPAAGMRPGRELACRQRALLAATSAS